MMPHVVRRFHSRFGSRLFPLLVSRHVAADCSFEPSHLVWRRKVAAYLRLDEGAPRFHSTSFIPCWHGSILPIIANQLDLSSIPVIECRSYAGAQETIWTAPLCAHAEAEISVHIAKHGGRADCVSIDVTTRDTDWRCTYIIRDWDLQTPYPFFGDALDIGSLRLDNIYLPGLLESGITLPRLRDLRIDLRPHGDYAAMVWPLAWGVALSPDEGGDAQGTYSVPCSALETLSIVALETPMQVRDTEVVQLSEALGQLRRKDGARARLVLVGVSFFSVGLDQMFSSIQSVPFHRD